MITITAPRDPKPVEAENPDTAEDIFESTQPAQPAEPPKKAEPPLPDREVVLMEYAKLKEEYIAQGRKELSEAGEKARKLIADTTADCEKVFSEAQLQADKLKAEAMEKGFADGFQKGELEGNEKGYNEGYKKGLLKNKDTLLELKEAIEKIPEEKEKTIKKLERGMFDVIFDIAQKLTLDSLKQKDKAVLQKMVKAAAKEFRGAEYIKITLSELDLSENAETDLEAMRNILTGFKHIEFEVSRDAPSGTVIVDNGREITDASISTQLKMIEELGKGKYRDKPAEAEEISESETEEIEENELEEIAETEAEPIIITEEATVSDETAMPTEQAQTADNEEKAETTKNSEISEKAENSEKAKKTAKPRTPRKAKTEIKEEPAEKPVRAKPNKTNKSDITEKSKTADKPAKAAKPRPRKAVNPALNIPSDKNAVDITNTADLSDSIDGKE